MNVRVVRWGNSLGLRIPKSLAEEVGVEAGSEVDVAVAAGDLVVKPVRRRRYDLRELVRNITPTNLHSSVDTGGPVGREVW